jgi:3-deoxy-7-phosphoheptulonate synthase
VAAGADGLLIEVHPNPKEALVDGLQALTPTDFSKLMDELRQIAKCLGRTI